MNTTVPHIAGAASGYTEKLLYLLMQLPYPILMENKGLHVELANQAFSNLFQISASSGSLLGTYAIQFTPDIIQFLENPSTFQEVTRSQMQQAKSAKVNILLKDGRTFLRTYIPYLGGDDTVRSHIWIYEEVTHVTESSNKANSYAVLLEQLLDVLPLDIRITDDSHKYIYLNKIAEPNDSLRSWLIGKTDFEKVGLEKKGMEGAFSRMKQLNEVVVSKHPIFEQKSSSNGTFQFQLSPLMHPNHSKVHVASVGWNISQQKLNEKLLGQTMELYQQLMNDLDELVFTIDRTGVIRYVNPAFENAFSTSYTELVGQPLKNYIAGNSYEWIIQSSQELLDESDINDHQKKTGTLSITLSKGVESIFDIKVQKFTQVGYIEPLTVIFLADVTSHVQTQKELEQVLKKERQLSDMKTVFVNMVSHELRTPLSVIQSSAEILEMLSAESELSSEEVKNYAQSIVEEVTQLKSLMDELLLISRIESDKMKFEPAEIDVIQFIHQLVQAHFLPWKDGRRLFVEARGLERLVKADTFMLRHILMNILENAFKYSPQAEAPHLRIFFASDHWSLVCRDFGIGIPEADLPQLGSSFERAGNVGDIEGTGLGLVVVRYFIEKHAGSLQFESAESIGTVVTLTFPYEPCS